MTGVELFLLLAGVVFMVGSFFITEKLSPSELNKIAELSEGELKKIISRGLEEAGTKIEDTIDNQIDASTEKVERAMEKETNEKIMAISEYSDTVIENMNKTHNEIMFLYSMLNDKHTELTGLASDLQKIASNVRNLQETTKKSVAEKAPAAVQTQIPKEQPKVTGTEPDKKVKEAEKQPKKSDKENHNKEILALHKEGLSEVEIAKKFGVGLGEVKLVIGLYKGDTNS